MPRHEHGYCVDDVARGLVVVCREPSPPEELVTLARRYLYFLAQAQAPDGRFRNRLGYDRRWRDEPGTEDCWGRALWGLGTAAARGPTAGIREESLARFELQRAGPLAVAARHGVRGARRRRDPRRAGLTIPARSALLASAVAVIGEPPAGRGVAVASTEAQLRERGHRRGRHRGRLRTRP